MKAKTNTARTQSHLKASDLALLRRIQTLLNDVHSSEQRPFTPSLPVLH